MLVKCVVDTSMHVDLTCVSVCGVVLCDARDDTAAILSIRHLSNTGLAGVMCGDSVAVLID